MRIITSSEMRVLEAAAISSGSVTGLDLMERAGIGVVDALIDWRGDIPGRVLVLCGPGNNGGDGFVIARHLRQRGSAVDVMLPGDESRLPPDAATNLRRWREIGEVQPFDLAMPGEAPDIIIDALFGIGLSRPLENVAAALEGRAPVVSVDIPSGLCAESGASLGGGAIRADLTVTFAHPKPGHFLGEGPAHCGALRVVDIGVKSDAGMRLISPPFAGLGKTADGHKYQHGHVLVLSGGVGKGGAARLAARGALRIGAGLVTLGAPPSAIIENAARLDAIMLRPVRDGAALRVALEDRRINALVPGPGLGIGERTRELVETAFSAGERGVVLDADALTSFSDNPEALFRMTRGRRAVLTPHMGEFARLFPAISEKLKTTPGYSRIEAARAAAAQAGCVVLLKGPDTVVADPEGGVAIISAAYERTCPWLATAGAGDVLAGMIAGLMARGLDLVSAAELAAWLHQEAAIRFGPGLIAEDLPESLPAVFRALEI